ncbi:MAG TPA: DegT/DnrJ/EryC1/StrS family aminotransferase [Acidimicrobiales bacterium]|nr:DegT/DnrJ/EryC1/StrS family aminotransferase [Acidimicrobiales bacterium]
MITPPAVVGGPQAFPDGLPITRPYVPGIPALASRLQSILDSGRLTNGPTVGELEEKVAQLLGVAHVVGVSSCTAGLMLVLQALEATGRVVLPSFTFSASAHAVVWAGGAADFAEVDGSTCTLDPADVAPMVEGACAMTATHVYGTPCRTDELQALADGAGIPLVYDAAHALGSKRGGVPIGGFGAAEVFSLSPTKVVVAGEGGLVATNDAGLAEACRLGRDYGNPGDYDCRFPGLNARLSELHAAVALASLEGLDERVAYRSALAARFAAGVAGVAGLRPAAVGAGDTSTFKDLTVIVEAESFGLTAEQLGRALRAEGIDSRRYYHPPIHQQKAYASRWAERRPLPVTELLSTSVLSVPLWSHMTPDHIDGMADAVVRIHTDAEAVRHALA